MALVDCDTVWANDALKEGLCPFNNPQIGGVATKQEVLHPKTLAQRIFSMLLDLRYSDDLPFLSTLVLGLEAETPEHLFFDEKSKN